MKTVGPGTRADQLRLAAAVLLAMLVLWPLFAGGMYKESYQLAAVWHLTAAVACIVALGAAEHRRLALTPARVAALVLWMAYALSAVVSPSAPRAALQELLKQGLYLGVFVVASELVLSARLRPSLRPTPEGQPREQTARGWRGLLTVSGLALGIWGGAAAMTLASLGAAAGIVPSDFIIAGRVYTYIDYPNSAAALFASAFLLGLGVRGVRPAGGRWTVLVMGIGQWSLLSALVLTLSRGAWLVFPLALASLLLLWPSRQRLAVLVEVALLGAAALAVGPMWLSYLGRPMPGVLFLAGGLILAVLAGWLARLVGALSPRRALLWLAIAAIAGAAVVAGLQASGLLPETLTKRIAGISLSGSSVWERIEWTRDALRMVKDYPVFGVGGGGWFPRHFQYQRYPYYTKEVHNGFAETWLEAGSLGLAALLALIALTGVAAWRACRAKHEGDPSEAMLLSGLAAGAAMLILHSAIDFDLSLGCVGVFLWAILGMIDGLATGDSPTTGSLEVRPTKGARRGRKAPGFSAAPARGIVLGWALVLSLVSVSLFAAPQAENRAIQVYEQGDYQGSVKALALACRLDPLSPRLRLERAGVSKPPPARRKTRLTWLRPGPSSKPEYV